METRKACGAQVKQCLCPNTQCGADKSHSALREGVSHGQPVQKGSKLSPEEAAAQQPQHTSVDVSDVTALQLPEGLQPVLCIQDNPVLTAICSAEPGTEQGQLLQAAAAGAMLKPKECVRRGEEKSPNKLHCLEACLEKALLSKTLTRPRELQ